MDGDKKITEKDRTVIGKNFPSWTGGLNLSVGYKNFDLSALFQGAFDVDGYYTAEAAYAFYNGATALKRRLSHFSLLFEKVLSLAVALAVLLFLHSEQADSSDYVLLPLAHGSA